MEYVNYSGYDEILFLIVKDPVVDTRKIGLFGSLEEKRVYNGYQNLDHILKI